MMKDDPESLVQHQRSIVDWFQGYRMGRSVQTLNPGLPQGNGWLVIAQYCREYMREQRKVICTIAEIIETLDQWCAEAKKERIPRSVFDLAPDYEMVSVGARIIS